MSYQAYLDTIKKKTGKSPEDFRALAQRKGLLAPGVKAGEVLAWLKADFGLGHGHAMAMYGTIKPTDGPPASRDEQIDKHFSGRRARWRDAYGQLMAAVAAFGNDVSVQPTNSYLSLLRGGKKFGTVHVAADRIDIGIKDKAADAGDRLTAAGTWNTMVTHRVTVDDPQHLDAELIGWLKAAYDHV
jgi:hypothetical protein